MNSVSQYRLSALATISIENLSALKAFATETALPHDIWDNADTYLKDFVTVVQASINQAHIKHDEIVQEIRSMAEQAMQGFQTWLDDVTTYMELSVAAYREQATEENRELVENCILQYTDDMKSVTENATTDITNCVAQLEGMATSEVEESRDRLVDHLKIVDELSADVDSCRYNVANSEDCIAGVAIEILMLTLEVPTNVQEQTRRTEDLVMYNIGSLGYCAHDGIQGARIMSNIVLGYIRECFGTP